MESIYGNCPDCWSKAEPLKKALFVIKQTFSEAMETTSKRTPADQNIIGNLLTVIECDLKKRIKAL